MPEGHNGNFEKGHRLSSGEQQARAAEKIIQDAQRKAQQPSFGVEQSDKTRADDIRQRLFGDTEKHNKQGEANNHNPFAPTNEFFESLKQWKQRAFRKQEEPRADQYKYPRVITPNGVTTNPEELGELMAAWRKESDARFERLRKESAAKLNTFWRLPFGEQFAMFLFGTPKDMDTYNQILQEERMKLGLGNGQDDKT